MGIAGVEPDRRSVVGKGKIELALERVLHGACVIGGDILAIDPDGGRIVGDHHRDLFRQREHSRG